MSESTTDLNAAQSQNYDAQQMIENIATGEEKAPKVNVEKDYEKSKELASSSIDRTNEGAEQARIATSSRYELSEPEMVETPTESTGDPDQFREMAKEVNPVQAKGNVSDEMVKKAMDLGKPNE